MIGGSRNYEPLTLTGYSRSSSCAQASNTPVPPISGLNHMNG